MPDNKEPLCKHFLHSQHGDENTTSFHFRLKKTPDSIIESFTLTCIWDGTCIMSGDLGPLMWQQNFHRGPTYGFPNSETSLSYFAEKCHNADHNQKTEEWSAEKAIQDLKEHFAESQQDDPGFYKPEAIENLFNVAGGWDDYGNTEPGYTRMLEDLDEYLPGGEWYEYRFGYDWDTHFVRKFELLKSVAPLILEAISKKGVNPEANILKTEEPLHTLIIKVNNKFTCGKCSHFHIDKDDEENDVCDLDANTDYNQTGCQLFTPNRFHEGSYFRQVTEVRLKRIEKALGLEA